MVLAKHCCGLSVYTRLVLLALELVKHALKPVTLGPDRVIPGVFLADHLGTGLGILVCSRNWSTVVCELRGNDCRLLAQLRRIGGKLA